jgi:acetoin utilization protein AcuC
MNQVLFIGNESLWNRGHPTGHPMRPERLHDTWAMLRAYDAFAAPHLRTVAPRYPSDDDLLTFHTREYIEVVRTLSRGHAHRHASRCGFGSGDNPVFEGMYESESLKVGASLVGAQMLAKGRADRVFSFSGGLHHAHAGQASGFCLFGDAVIATNHLLDHGLRVAIIDIDAHHGDGVQEAFYDTSDVLTISMHESGETLFPGTGHIHERGEGAGLGFSINIPLASYTDDESVLWVFDQIVPAAVEKFSPDVVVAQFGVDAHWRDPLTHLCLTTHGLETLFERIAAFSPRLLAVGGGGYDGAVVSRAWTLAWGVLSGQIFADALPDGVAAAYDPPLLHDDLLAPIEPEEREWARRQNEQTVVDLSNLIG